MTTKPAELIYSKPMTDCKVVRHPFISDAFAIEGVSTDGGKVMAKDQAGGVLHWWSRADANAAAARFNA